MDEVKEKLKTEEHVQVIFRKKSGDLRVMNCSLNQVVLPPVPPEESKDKPKKEPNPDVQPVYDLDAKAWRSFRWDSVIAVDGKLILDNFVLLDKNVYAGMRESAAWLNALEAAGVDNWEGIDHAHSMMEDNMAL